MTVFQITKIGPQIAGTVEETKKYADYCAEGSAKKIKKATDFILDVAFSGTNATRFKVAVTDNDMSCIQVIGASSKVVMDFLKEKYGCNSSVQLLTSKKEEFVCIPYSELGKLLVR